MDNFTFDGFEQANTVPVPDVLFDKLLPHLNEAQLKVMLYIIRRTLGFKKTADAISLNQFRWGITTKEGKKLDEGCGLKNFTSITKALRELERMNCIESEKRETGIGDQDTTVYHIRFRGTTQNVVPTTQDTVPPLSNVVGVLRQTEYGTTPTVEGVLRQTYPQETVLQDTDSQERTMEEESTGEQSDTTTSAPSLSLDAASLPQSEIDTHSQQGDTHGLLPSGDTDLPSWDDHRDSSAAAHSAHDDALDRTGQLDKENTDAPLPAGTRGGSGDLAGAGLAPRQPLSEDLRSLPPATRPVLQAEAAPEIDEEWCNAETEHRLPAIPKTVVSPGGTSPAQNRDASPRNVAVESDLGAVASAPIPPVPSEVSPPRTMRATVVPSPPKWDAQAMLARAEVLRDKPFSESARPKETKAARKLFARKPDLTEEEFTSAFQHWNTPWWHETNGPFCITDLAAVPKNKSEMRLIIALEKLAMPKKPPGGQVIQMPTTRGQQWRSSFDDPDYDMSSEFYPSEAERSKPRAAAK